MLLAQLHSNHTRTPSARWARGKRCTGTQFNSFGLHSTVQQEKSSHYMQVIAACDLHAFLSVQQMLTSLYRVQESDVFHFVVQVTTRKSQDIRARNTFHHVVQATTCKSQQFIDIPTRHLTKHIKINMYCKFCF